MVAPPIRSTWNPFRAEFNCRGCGGHDAYRSRPRNLFERYLLPVFFLRPVRCDRCYLRSYALRTVAAHERAHPGDKRQESQPSPDPTQQSRIAQAMKRGLY